MTTTMRAFVIVVMGVAILVAISRACASPAGGQPTRSRVHLPTLSQGAPRCNRWRGDDWWPCVEATLTAEARISSTPTATLRPWSSRTPTPTPTLIEQSGGNREPMYHRYLPLAPTGGGQQAQPITRGGIHVGWCSPMADGCYTAGHALRRRGAYLFGGLALPYSIDLAGRDLGHAAGFSAGSTALRAAQVGEALEWSNGRAAGLWRVLSASRGEVVVCAVEGSVIYGDSGTGGYATSDGALVGILTNADLSQGRTRSPGCNGQQQARLEQVP